MSQRTLNLLWRTFANAFLVLLFIVTFSYALLVSYGYRFDPLQIKVLESGIISLNSVTPEANIYLDGQIIPNLQTPTHTPNLSLRAYHLELKKPGFHTWSKNILVKEDIVTHVGEINLVPENSTAREITYSEADVFAISANQIATYSSSDNLIRLFDLNGQILEETESPASPLQLEYLNNRLYLQDTKGNFWDLLSDRTWQISNTLPIFPKAEAISPDQTKSLSINSHEIWSKDQKNKTETLLFRFSKPATYVNWFSNNQIIFEQDNQLRICDQDGQNCVLLAATDAESQTPFFLHSHLQVFFIQDNSLRSLDLSSRSGNVFGNLFK
jgi:hypothetical protein